MKKVGIIGCGNMGKVLIDGLVNFVGRKNIFCFDIDEKKVLEVKNKYKVNILSSNKDLVLNSDFIILAVKPQQIKEVLEKVKNFIDDKKVVISLAAGIKIEFLEKFLKQKQIVRVMPNLPLKVGLGISAICKNKFCKKESYEFAKKIFSIKGEVVEIKERFFDLITAVSGSGPAYIFYISEIIQKVGIKLGLPKKFVPQLVNLTILGAAKMLNEEKIAAEELKKAVASKGGTTEQALSVFEKYKIEKIFYKAIKKAYIRAKQLSELLGS